MLFHTFETDLTIILLANTNAADLDDFCQQIAKIAAQEPFRR